MTAIRTILAATALAGSLTAAAPASAATFVVSQVVGQGFVSGVINTDDTLGKLAAANIKTWTLMVNDGTTSFVLNEANSNLMLSGGLSATAAGLFFDFTNLNSLIDFQATDGTFGNYFCMDGANRGCRGYQGSSFYVKSTGTEQRLKFSGNVQFATAAAVPEPATWAMMLLGFGMLGAAIRYRRSGAARVVYA